MESRDLIHKANLTFIDQVRELYILLDEDLNVVYMNSVSKQYCKITTSEDEVFSYTDLFKDKGDGKLYKLLLNINERKLSPESLPIEIVDDVLWKIYGVFNKSKIIGLVLSGDIENASAIENDYFSLVNMLAHLPGNLYWLDTEFRQRGCNNNVLKMLGLSKDEYIGKTYEELAELVGWKKGEEQSFKKDDLEVFLSGQPRFNVEEPPLRHKDGSLHYYLTTRVPMRDISGNIVGIAGISTDISELKKTQNELVMAKEAAEDASKAKSKFIADISHDLRTPMTGVQGMFYCIDSEIHSAFEKMQACQSKFPDNDFYSAFQHSLIKIEEFVKDGDISSKRITALFDGILEKIILDQIELEPVDFNLYALLHKQLDLFLAQSTNKSIKLTLTIDDNVPEYLTGVDFYLERSLTNLVSNAMKFTEAGSINVLATIKNDNPQAYKTGDVITLTIQVKDTGIGMPKDKLEEIFETFSRLTPSYKGEYDGFGLGLANVKGYTANMQGEIHVESEVGKGSCFTITAPFIVCDKTDVSNEVDASAENQLARFRSHLPLVKRSKPSSSEEMTIPPLSSSPNEDLIEKNKHILVVEDSIPAATFVIAMLKSLGCSTDHAKNGIEAVEFASQNDYRLILMDIGLPDSVGELAGFDGDEAARRICALSDPKRANVPIVALTGHGNNPDKRKAIFDAGIQKILTKPATIADLKVVINEYISTVSSNDSSDKEQSEVTPKDGKVMMKLPIIDWEGCVKKCLDDPDFAHRMLTMLSEDLLKTQDILATHYRHWDPKALRAELHRIRGSLCYFELPELESALRAFHETVKHKPDDTERLETQFQTMMQAIGRFRAEWSRLSTKLDRGND